MSERRYNILSTTSLPFERIKEIPDSINVSVVPFIQITPRPSVELIPIIAEIGSGNHSVIFTSVHAVKFVGECLKFKPAWKIYCIRQETRIAVEKFFGSESIIRYAESASALARCLIEDGTKEAVFFCGDQRLNTIPDNLIKHAVRLTEIIVYSTRLTPVLLKKQPDAILFFSPTAVRSFFSLNNLSPETRVFAVGKTTAAVLADFTSNPVFVSPETDKAFVFNMAVEYAASHPVT